MKYNHLLPIIVPFLIWLLFEVFFFAPKMIYVALVLSCFLVLFTIRQFIRSSKLAPNGWNFFLLPALFLTSLAAYAAIIASMLLVQILFIVNAVFLYFYFCSIYCYLVQPTTRKKFSLPNISSYGAFLTLFFASSAIYGLQSFLNISIWPFAIIIIIVAGLAIYQVIWAEAIEIRLAFVCILISSLILVELAWSISFLPLNFNVAGLILAVCYYVLAGLTRFHLLEKLNRKIIKLYLAFGFGSLLIVLLTARWM